MFRHAPDQQSTSQSCESPADKSDTENVIPPMDSNDLHSWVKNTLRSMNYSLKDEDLTAASLQVWQRVLFERLQWQNQSQSVTEENISLRRKYEILDREKCALKGQVECNQQVNICMKSIVPEFIDFCYTGDKRGPGEDGGLT